MQYFYLIVLVYYKLYIHYVPAFKSVSLEKSFNIVSESGNYEHWKYSVEYTENLSHWPYLTNTAIANFDIRAIPKQETYFIVSAHDTCFFYGLFCLHSDSRFKFIRGAYGAGALCEEFVEYSCPRVWSSFCLREVSFQRSKIMVNLKKHFAKTV